LGILNAKPIDIKYSSSGGMLAVYIQHDTQAMKDGKHNS